jgi:hypothetical protein
MLGIFDEESFEGIKMHGAVSGLADRRLEKSILGTLAQHCPVSGKGFF